MPHLAPTAERASRVHAHRKETSQPSSTMPAQLIPGALQGGAHQTSGHVNARSPAGQVQGAAQASGALAVLPRGPPAHRQEGGQSHRRDNLDSCHGPTTSTAFPQMIPRPPHILHSLPYGCPFTQLVVPYGEFQYPRGCPPPHMWGDPHARCNSWEPYRQPYWMPVGPMAPYPLGPPMPPWLHYPSGPSGPGHFSAGGHPHPAVQGGSRGANGLRGWGHRGHPGRSFRRPRQNRQKAQLRLEALKSQREAAGSVSDQDGAEQGWGAPSTQEGTLAGSTSRDATEADPDGSEDGDTDSDDSDHQVLRRVEKPEARDETQPEVCNSWEWMMENVMQQIIRRLDAPGISAMREVCRRWLEVADRNLEILRPSKAKIHTVIAQFPHVTTIDMSACQNVRNRNLSILGRSHLRVKALFIGQACVSTYGKPRITNSALNSIALMTGLHSLSLCDCSAITNNGMMALSTLTGLTSLAINKCPRISDKGFAVVEHLKLLQTISVYGCVKVADGLLQILSCLKHLSFLQLGYTKVSEEGIAQLRKFPALSDLRFFAEDTITDASLADLAYITNLTGLSLACCGDHITGEGLLKLVKALPQLRFFDLQNCVNVGDDFVSELPKVAKNIDFLQLQGTALGARGLQALTGLSSLRRLFLDSNQSPTLPNALPTPHSLLSVSELTQLTALEIQSRHLPPGLLYSVGRLRKLARLSLSDCDATHGPTAPDEQGCFSSMGGTGKGGTTGFMALSNCTSLTNLSFSHISVKSKEVVDLIHKLPLLAEVQLTDCAGEDKLATNSFPGISLHINTRPLPPIPNRPAHLAA